VGNQLAVLVDNILDPGSYEINWNASSLPSGVYFYKLSAANFSATKKLMLIK
jgi:hypothetical protein